MVDMVDCSRILIFYTSWHLATKYRPTPLASCGLLGQPFVFSFGESLRLAPCKCKVPGQDLVSSRLLPAGSFRPASVTKMAFCYFALQVFEPELRFKSWQCNQKKRAAPKGSAPLFWAHQVTLLVICFTCHEV